MFPTIHERAQSVMTIIRTINKLFHQQSTLTENTSPESEIAFHPLLHNVFFKRRHDRAFITCFSWRGDS